MTWSHLPCTTFFERKVLVATPAVGGAWRRAPLGMALGMADTAERHGESPQVWVVGPMNEANREKGWSGTYPSPVLCGSRPNDMVPCPKRSSTRIGQENRDEFD